MAIQLSTAVRNARLDAIESTMGASAIMELRTGGAPANCAAANSGTVIATINLPSDWMAAASAGAKALAGTWTDLSADAAGTVGHFRVFRNNGTTCGIQGTAGSAGTEDLVLDNAAVTSGQPISITQFTITDGNA